MKKHVLCFLLILVCIAAVGAQSRPTITIVNNTGYTIWDVCIVPTASDTWGDSYLAPNEILRNGSSITVELPYPLNVVNTYDILIEDTDGDPYIKWDVYVTNGARIVFTFDDIDFTYYDYYYDDYVSYDGPPITIVNNTGYPIQGIYIVSTASDSWGNNRLGWNEILRNNNSISLNLPYPINVVNRYDIMLEDTDGDCYYQWDVYVTANSRIVFTFDDIDWWY